MDPSTNSSLDGVGCYYHHLSDRVRWYIPKREYDPGVRQLKADRLFFFASFLHLNEIPRKSYEKIRGKAAAAPLFPQLHTTANTARLNVKCRGMGISKSYGQTNR
jgi:hypothetical protein